MKARKGELLTGLKNRSYGSCFVFIPFRGDMLELVCGTGHWTTFFCEEGFRVTAVDTSEAMLSEAKKKDIGCATFLHADAANLPFADESFSVVASITMLEFVEISIKFSMKRIACWKRMDIYYSGGWMHYPNWVRRKTWTKYTVMPVFMRPMKFGNIYRILEFLSCGSGCIILPSFDLLDETDKQDTVQPAL